MTDDSVAALDRTEPAEREARRFPRLGRRARRAVFTVHIVSAGVWIGIDVVLGVCVFTAVFTSSTRTESLAYQALDLFAVWPLFITGLVSLASGVTLGLGTNYGLVKYWWVAVKLALNILLAALTLVALRPAVSEATTYGVALAAGQPTDASVDDLVFPPIVSPLALLFATILGVYKPWGRLRKARR